MRYIYYYQINLVIQKMMGFVGGKLEIKGRVGKLLKITLTYENFKITKLKLIILRKRPLFS